MLFALVAAVIVATPTNFATVLKAAQPGQVILLSDGDYGRVRSTFYDKPRPVMNPPVVVDACGTDKAVFTSLSIVSYHYRRVVYFRAATRFGDGIRSAVRHLQSDTINNT